MWRPSRWPASKRWWPPPRRRWRRSGQRRTHWKLCYTRSGQRNIWTKYTVLKYNITCYRADHNFFNSVIQHRKYLLQCIGSGRRGDDGAAAEELFREGGHLSSLQQRGQATQGTPRHPERQPASSAEQVQSLCVNV